ncbi:hypothetical protein GW17_00028920 [Ensete ventricosum]|nr:hypothetical protein GW17_00028920 [Ensete ventricosum]
MLPLYCNLTIIVIASIIFATLANSKRERDRERKEKEERENKNITATCQCRDLPPSSSIATRATSSVSHCLPLLPHLSPFFLPYRSSRLPCDPCRNNRPPLPSLSLLPTIDPMLLLSNAHLPRAAPNHALRCYLATPFEYNEVERELVKEAEDVEESTLEAIEPTLEEVGAISLVIIEPTITLPLPSLPPLLPSFITC